MSARALFCHFACLAAVLVGCSQPTENVPAFYSASSGTWGAGLDAAQGDGSDPADSARDLGESGTDEPLADANGSEADGAIPTDIMALADGSVNVDGGSAKDIAKSDAALKDTAVANQDAQAAQDAKDTKDTKDAAQPGTDAEGEDAEEEPGTDEWDVGGSELDVVYEAPPPAPTDNTICAKKVSTVPITATIGGPGKVDIIIFVDTSGSMGTEAAWVSKNLNSFAAFLQAQKLDMRVVLIGQSIGSIKLCINPPLASSACGMKGPSFLQIPDYVGSTDGLKKFITAYPKFQAFLRPDASKNIVAVTDDNSSVTAASFTASLANLKNPGFGANWVFHSIVSYVNPDPAASQPAKGCSTGASLSKVYLTLSKQTGGATFQICQPDWNPIFDQLAKSVAATAKSDCAYAIPWPNGQVISTASLKVIHTEQAGVIEPLTPLASAAACEATPKGWYLDDPLAPQKATVCPQTCQAMQGGHLVFDFGCL